MKKQILNLEYFVFIKSLNVCMQVRSNLRKNNSIRAEI